MSVIALEQKTDVVHKGVTVETVLDVQHFTDRLFSFRTTRPASFRFRSGEFVMIGLEIAGKPLLRAYSIASPAWDDQLEFYSIKVEDGPLTSRLQRIQPGDQILLGRKPTGTLVLDALSPGKRLYLLSSGTGIAPFASIMRDPETYERYDQIILVHGCRLSAELRYGAELVAGLTQDPLLGEIAPEKVAYVSTATREAHPVQGRVTELISTGRLFECAGMPAFDPATDRAMLCGALDMIADTKALLEQRGFREGSNAAPGDFVVERAFVG